MTFYRDALGAKMEMVMHYKDCPDTPPPGMVPPGSENKVMHASFRIGETTVMASDGHCQGHPSFQGFSLSITVPSEAEADRAFGALAEGGKVSMPLGKTFFSPALRDGHRPLRRQLDGDRRSLTTEDRSGQDGPTMPVPIVLMQALAHPPASPAGKARRRRA